MDNPRSGALAVRPLEATVQLWNNATIPIPEAVGLHLGYH